MKIFTMFWVSNLIENKTMNETIITVLSVYALYMERHSIEKWIRKQFQREREQIRHFLLIQNHKTALEKTISLFEFLSEHDAVHPKIQYPGPTEAFKKLVQQQL